MHTNVIAIKRKLANWFCSFSLAYNIASRVVMRFMAGNGF